MPIVVQSDSQLVIQQINGKWRANHGMQAYCNFLIRLRRKYPYQLIKVPRTQDTMAVSLAQKYILKNSGRTMTLEHGRFNTSKQPPGNYSGPNEVG